MKKLIGGILLLLACSIGVTLQGTTIRKAHSNSANNKTEATPTPTPTPKPKATPKPKPSPTPKNP